MRTFLTISAAAALLALALSSCSDAAPAAEKELVYEGSMAEPQIGTQPIAGIPADSIATK